MVNEDKFPKPKSSEETLKESIVCLDKSLETIIKLEDDMKILRFNFACFVSSFKRSLEEKHGRT